MFNFKIPARQNASTPLIYFKNEVFLRSLYFEKMFELTKHLEGNVFECGVGTGIGLCTWAALVESVNSKRQIVGLDSFQGFSKFSESDGAHVNEKEYTRNYAKYTIEYVKYHLQTYGISNENINRIKFIKGYVPTVFDEHPIEQKISILNLDFDLYEPVKYAFHKLYPWVETGGVIMFDEYDKERDLIKWPGSKKAVDEAMQILGLDISKIRKDRKSGYSYLIKE